MSSLTGKVTLITGASSGIGAGTSVLFAKLGAVLALNGRDVDNLNKVAKQCTDCGAAEVTDGVTDGVTDCGKLVWRNVTSTRGVTQCSAPGAYQSL